MVTARVERRLAAILAADVVGYSALMERDEDRTLARLKALREELTDPLIAEHHGRVVKLMGDGTLVEFASVVDAVRCAVLIQRGMAEREAELPGTERVRLRIGVNLGDVIREADGDLYGDGVNVAARLEQLAEPGGITVSGTAYDHLGGKLGCSFEYLGERRLKNIERPVRAYRVELDAGIPAASAPGAAPPPDRPAIAVLPFENPGGDPGQAYFADGITEDIITGLSRFRGLLVIARGSSFVFRGGAADAADAAEIGRRLGAGFLLEGSVRRAVERVRITAWLTDAATGARLWAERYDRTLEDIFAVQDEVAATIAATLAGRVQAAGLERARRKPTADLAAYDCVLRGMEHLAGYGEEANARARAMFERAVGLDPGYALAKAFLALTIYVEEFNDRGRTEGPGLERALALASEAVALDGEDCRCHRVLAQVLLALRRFGPADHHSERALALNPNDAHTAADRAYVLIYLGRPGEAVTRVRQAMRLNPLHPLWYWTMLARALHFSGEHEEAIGAYERYPTPGAPTFVYLAACHARVGRADEARHFVTKALAARPDFSSSAWVAALPFRREEDRGRLLEELRAAGLPA
jgi:adenylate cyclase